MRRGACEVLVLDDAAVEGARAPTTGSPGAHPARRERQAHELLDRRRRTASRPVPTHPRPRVPVISTVSDRRSESVVPVCAGLRQLSVNVVRGPPLPGVT